MLKRIASLFFEVRKVNQMAVTIPPVPEGIPVDNLYGEVYGDLPPLAWSNPDLHARIQWMQSQVAFSITAWYSPVNAGSPGFPALRMSTMFRAQVEEGVGIDFDVRNLMQMPDALVYALKRLKNPDVIPEQGNPYPGYAALHPPTASPIGAEIVPAPWAGRRLYASAPGDTYPVGGKFETDTANYEKVEYGIPGAGPFGTGGRRVPAWTAVYQK
jgi:hypothetical protein